MIEEKQLIYQQNEKNTIEINDLKKRIIQSDNVIALLKKDLALCE